jgi:hypothetical protein
VWLPQCVHWADYSAGSKQNVDVQGRLRMYDAIRELLYSKVKIFRDMMLYRIAIIIIIIIIIITKSKEHFSSEYGNGRFFVKHCNCLPVDMSSYSRRL